MKAYTRGDAAGKYDASSKSKINLDYNTAMSNISDEFLEIARDLDSIIVKFESSEVKLPLQKLEDASNQVKKAWSGSWLGYHSRIYYRDFHSPPPGARFSQEWGFMDAISNDTEVIGSSMI